jgi:hypothetical protein
MPEWWGRDGPFKKTTHHQWQKSPNNATGMFK